MARPVVDLPQPDSPTRPSVSPFSTKKSIPSTARTAPTCRWKMIPCVSGKCIFKALTSRRFLPLPAVAVLRALVYSPVPGVTAISLPLVDRRRRRRRRPRTGRGALEGHLRDLLLDLFDHTGVADLAVPIGVDEPAALLRPPAARLVVGLGIGDVPQLRLLLLADVSPVLAARLEAASRRRRDEVRRQAFDREQLPLALLVKTRDRAQQAPRVRHLRIREELGRVGLLDDLAAVHHVDTLGHPGDNTEVVGDEDERGAELPREILQQVQDLGLDRYVQR